MCAHFLTITRINERYSGEDGFRLQDTMEKSSLEPNQIEASGFGKTGASSSSGPIDIPGSPARPSPSRPSPRDSLESLEEGEEGNWRLNSSPFIPIYSEPRY